jgi:putative phage-type endonuclease
MIIQGSAEWLQERCGKATASRIADIIATTKSGPSASRANYAAQLVAERLTGVPAETFKSAAMEWGTATEAEAKAAYAFYTGREVEEVSFILHPSIPMAGASPDGHIGEDGALEAKCPNSSTHIDTLLGASVPGKYITQIQWQMACSGRAWTDFISFDPRLPESMRLFVKRVPRDPTMIADLEAKVRTFLAEVDATVAALRAKYETREAA